MINDEHACCKLLRNSVRTTVVVVFMWSSFQVCLQHVKEFCIGVHYYLFYGSVSGKQQQQDPQYREMKTPITTERGTGYVRQCESSNRGQDGLQCSLQMCHNHGQAKGTSVTYRHVVDDIRSFSS